MSGRLSAVVAIARFEIREQWRSRAAWIAAIGFIVLLAAGHWSYWTTLPPRPDDDRLFGHAYLLAAIALLRFGTSRDHELGFDEYLVTNLTTPARYLAGKLLAACASLAALGGIAFAAALALSLGEWRYAVWYTVLFTLVSQLFLPAVLLAELLFRTRLPAAVVFFGFVVALAVARAVSSPMVLVTALGLDTERFAFETLAPLARRAVGSTLLLGLLYPVWRLRLPAR